MPRKKSSEKRAEQGKAPALLERPVPMEARARPTGEYRQAICPVCGRAAGTKRLEYPQKGYYSPVPTENFWSYTQDFDPDKPFGVIQEVGAGKGHSFKVIGHFSPEEDIDGYFPLVKARLLNAVKEWLNKGWLTRDEVAHLLGGIY